MRQLAAVIALAVLGVTRVFLLPVPVESAPAIQPANPREAWAVDLLGRLGNAGPSGEIVAFMVDWSIAEDSSNGALARNNAFNTTLCLPGRMTGAINGDGACGVQGYATWHDGIEATALTLEQANFAGIRAALLTNDAQRAKLELFNSAWASSHYGYGAAWPK